MARKVGLMLLALALVGGYWLFRSTPHERVEAPRKAVSTPPTPASPPTSPPLPPTNEPPAPPAVPSEPERPESEEAFLRQLQRLHLTDKAAALELALRGEDWYSDEGPLAEARKAMIVTLLVDLDRMSEARAEVRRFIERYPESPYRPMLQGKTGIHPRPGAPNRR